MKALANGLKKAVIELLILKLLSEKDMYGYQISQELKKRSNNSFSLLEGSMYPILYRLTDNGCISFYEKKVGKRQTRIYYHLEGSGASHFNQMRDEYRESIQIINFLLDSKEGDILDAFEQ
jgi:PadR family transcriptional regulator PadR